MPKEFRVLMKESSFTAFSVRELSNKKWVFSAYFDKHPNCLTSTYSYIVHNHPFHHKAHSSDLRESDLGHYHISFSGSPNKLYNIISDIVDCGTKQQLINTRTAKTIVGEFRKFKSDKTISSSSTFVLSTLKQYPNAQGTFPTISEHQTCIESSLVTCHWNTKTNSWQSLALTSNASSSASSPVQSIVAPFVAVGVGICATAALLYHYGFLSCFKQKTSPTPRVELSETEQGNRTQNRRKRN